MTLVQEARENIRNELAKLQGLSWSKRAEYIWDYYKIPILILTFLIILTVSMISSFTSSDEIYLNNAVINLPTLEQSALSPLSTDFQSSQGLDEKDMLFTDAFQMSLDNQVSELDFQSFQRLQAIVMTGELDLLFTDRTTLEQLAQLGLYSDLQALLPTDLWAVYQERIIELPNPETGELYPAAIDIADIPIIESCKFLSDSVVVCISVTAPHLDHCLAMLEYLSCGIS